MWIRLWIMVKGVMLVKKMGFFGGLVMPKLSADELFVRRSKDRFLATIGPIIDGGFADFRGFNDNVDLFGGGNDVTGGDELTWKRRTIILNTPYGNVGMCYDMYYRAFSYYADTKNVPYVVLNCVAMNYVLTYRCLDFYVDNTMVENWITRELVKDEQVDHGVADMVTNNRPFLPRLEERGGGGGGGVTINKKIMVKLKNYRMDFGKKDNGEPNIIYNKNRFIYRGKITDMPTFNVKRKVKKVGVMVGGGGQKKMSFREYKDMIQKAEATVQDGGEIHVDLFE